MKFGDKLYALRKAANMKQHMIAKAIGITQSNYCCLEKGKTLTGNVNVKTLVGLCKVFDLTIDELLSDEMPAKVQQPHHPVLDKLPMLSSSEQNFIIKIIDILLLQKKGD